MSLCKGTTLFRGNQKKRQESMIICTKIIILPHKKRINMKKLINFIIAALLLPFAGCKDVPRERPLAEGLVVYKEVNETGDTLTGVRRTADSTVLVTPAAYREVRAEEHFIVCRRGEYSYEVFFRKDGNISSYAGGANTATRCSSARTASGWASSTRSPAWCATAATTILAPATARRVSTSPNWTRQSVRKK